MRLFFSIFALRLIKKIAVQYIYDMWRVLVVVFLIFGTIVGSGFSSGKEIFVYFGRFGALSYLFIALAGVMFFFLLRFFLLHGQKCAAVVQKSGFLRGLVAFISLVFCASMFAGVKNLFSHFPLWLSVLATSAVLVCCLWLTTRGIRGLEKFNLAVMPLTAALFFAVLVAAACEKTQFSLRTSFFGQMLLAAFGENGAGGWGGSLVGGVGSVCAFSGIGGVFSGIGGGFSGGVGVGGEILQGLGGLLFCPLYVALNCSLGGLVICRAGGTLSKKQCNLAAALSVALLLLFLFLGNFVLQKNPLLQSTDMPFLMLWRGHTLAFCVAFGIIFVGCFTTLLSMCFNLKTALDGVCKNITLSTALAVFVPFAISSLGFSPIVQFLYPICSVLGIFVLIFMVFANRRAKRKCRL